MPFNEISDAIKKYIYIIHSETFHSATNKSFIERYVAKHPLLRPEFIVVNDQVHGFKKMSKKVSSLEQFPIYLEVEGLIDEDVHYIESIDLYSEANINCQNRLTDIIYLSKLYDNYIQLDRIINVNDPKKERLVIVSKVQEFLINITEDSIMKTIQQHFAPLMEEAEGDDENAAESLKEGLTEILSQSKDSVLAHADSDEDDSDDDGSDTGHTVLEALIDIKQFNTLLGQHLRYFVHFIKLLDDILVKNIPLDTIEKNNDIFPAGDNNEPEPDNT